MTVYTCVSPLSRVIQIMCKCIHEFGNVFNCEIRGLFTSVELLDFMFFLTVHLRIIPVSDQLDAQFLL